MAVDNGWRYRRRWAKEKQRNDEQTDYRIMDQATHTKQSPATAK
jgi:hypothetical protein